MIKVFHTQRSMSDYSNWIGDRKIVDTIEEADIVFAEGGSDTSPQYYHSNVGKYTSCDPDRDKYEYELLRKVISLGKPIIGICRGAQVSCVLAGGKLVQHMTHPSRHIARLYDGSEITINSSHHQMQYPFVLPKTDYHMIAYAEGLSTIYLNGDNDHMILPTDDNNVIVEPEWVYYKKIKALSLQNHNEWMNINSEAVKISRTLLEHHLKDTLDMVLACKIPMSRLQSTTFEFSQDEIELYNQINGKEFQKKEAEKKVYAE